MFCVLTSPQFGSCRRRQTVFLKCLNTPGCQYRRDVYHILFYFCKWKKCKSCFNIFLCEVVKLSFKCLRKQNRNMEKKKTLYLKTSATVTYVSLVPVCKRLFFVFLLPPCGLGFCFLFYFYFILVVVFCGVIVLLSCGGYSIPSTLTLLLLSTNSN